MRVIKIRIIFWIKLCIYFYVLVLYHENKQDIHSNQREGKEHATIKLQINR